MTKEEVIKTLESQLKYAIFFQTEIVGIDKTMVEAIIQILQGTQ